MGILFQFLDKSNLGIGAVPRVGTEGSYWKVTNVL